jgi:hypothetical protein
MNIHEFIKQHDERKATRFLLLLLLGDLFFVILHIINEYTLQTSLFDVTADRKLPEIYQYFKFAAICLLLKHAAGKRTARQYYAWIAFFTYLLLDDSLRIHDKMEKVLAKLFTFEPMFGLTLKNYGELAVSAIAGSILLIPLLWAYLTGSRAFRAISHRLVVLIGLLVFFGVVVDVGRGVVNIHIGMFMDLIEDGGEMIAASLITWYAFKVAARDGDSAPRLLG